MNRREALRMTALAVGGSLSASLVTGVLSGCKAEPTLTWMPAFLNMDQAAALAELTERIIPRTDTPGAKDAGVPQFIDKMLKNYFQPEEQQAFTAGLAQLESAAKEVIGKSFAKGTPEEQDQVVQKLADIAKAEMEAAKANPPADGARPPKPFFNMAKELTVSGFFTSEVGATQVLKYEPVPGAFKGCIPFSEVGATWAT